MRSPDASRLPAADDVTIVVFEQRPRWAPELQRQFVGRDVRVRACRSVDDITPLFDEDRRNVLVLELSTDPLGCSRYLQSRAFRTQSVVVVGSAATSELEWAVRELGATAFVFDGVSGEELADVCRLQCGMPREHLPAAR